MFFLQGGAMCLPVVSDLVKKTMVDPSDLIERANVLVRIMAVVSGAIAFWAYFKGYTTATEITGMVTMGFVALSLFLNCHTVRKEWKKAKHVGDTVLRFGQEAGKTALAPMVVVTTVFALAASAVFCCACNWCKTNEKGMPTCSCESDEDKTASAPLVVPSSSGGAPSAAAAGSVAVSKPDPAGVALATVVASVKEAVTPSA